MFKRNFKSDIESEIFHAISNCCNETKIECYAIGGFVRDLIIGKNLASGFRWIVYQKTIGNTKAQYLNENFADTTSSTFWNNTSPTSSVFTIGSDNSWNGTSVFYCFAEKKGFSKFGSYVGNGSADGAFVYLGFKPAFVMVKRTDAAGHYWHIYDNKRSTSGSNVVDDVLYPNESFAEYSEARLDFVANGIKFKTGNTDINASGGTYIYMAFAENPLVGTNNIPATAR